VDRLAQGSGVGGRLDRADAPSGEPPARAEADPARTADATALIEKHTTLADLDEEGLGAELVALLPAGSEVVTAVLDALNWSDTDDVAFAICEAAGDEQIRSIARDRAGWDVMRRVVRELQAGYTTDAEAKQMQRVLNLISEVGTQRVSGSTGEAIEINGITFGRGALPLLDWIGETFIGEGARGHTAIAVGELVYSFDEGGWEVGETESEYLAKNTFRGAHVQVLDVPLEDAQKIQKHLNDAANTGIYLFGGEVCTDATAAALAESLGKLDARMNPQRFVGVREATGKVKRRFDIPAARPVHPGGSGRAP
jgi:hypothetical protein